jgi:hypothetical protein
MSEDAQGLFRAIAVVSCEVLGVFGEIGLRHTRGSVTELRTDYKRMTLESRRLKPVI